MKSLAINFNQWISLIFYSKQSKMEIKLIQYVERLNDLFLKYLDQKDLIHEKNLKAEFFRTENSNVNFGQNEQKKIFNNAHWWIALLIFFCVLADFYVMREVAGQFGISNPNFGVMVGLMLLLIELTLAALAFNSSDKTDSHHLINQAAKFVFLLFIPSMCFLNYNQNLANLSLGATELSLEMVKYKMIIISLFSLIIHFVLVINLENGFSSYRYAVALSKNSKMIQEIDVQYKYLKCIIKQIRSDGTAYLRELSRFNLLFPQSVKRVEYLPDGVISLINTGQDEDVINLKQSPLTQVKPGYSRTDLIKLQLGSKSMSDLNTESAPGYDQQSIKPSSEKTVRKTAAKEITKETSDVPETEGPETEIPQSYESFFGKKETYV